MKKEKAIISVVGTGAIGGYYGIMLSQLGHDVHFLLRSDYEHVKKHGLTLQSSVHGEVKLPQVNAYKDAADMPVSDIVVVALKTMQNKKVLPKVLPHITNENTVVILIQNGLGMEDEVAKWFPDLQVAGSTALILSHKEKNGIIVHEGYGAINFGSYNLGDRSILDRLAAEFKSINIPSSQQDLKEMRWKKLVWNMTFNGLSIVVNGNTDVILASHLDRARTIMSEVITAANANGVSIPQTYADELIPFTERMGSYAPSMRFDYLNKQPLELEYLYENPIIAGRKAGVEMPETEAVYQELLKV